jgi:hypothetical protein
VERWRSSFSSDKKCLEMPILVMAYLHERSILRDKQIKLMTFTGRAAAAVNIVNKTSTIIVSLRQF